MKAIITNSYDPNSDTIRKNRKENGGFFRSMSIIDRDKEPWKDKTMPSSIEARFYCPGHVVYCCLWIHGKDEHRHGGARAGGYGYHKSSAALEGAIRECGIDITHDDGRPAHFGGAGDEAMREALCAIADAIGLTNYFLFESHP